MIFDRTIIEDALCNVLIGLALEKPLVRGKIELAGGELARLFDLARQQVGAVDRAPADVIRRARARLQALDVLP